MNKSSLKLAGAVLLSVAFLAIALLLTRSDDHGNVPMTSAPEYPAPAPTGFSSAELSPPPGPGAMTASTLQGADGEIQQIVRAPFDAPPELLNPGAPPILEPGPPDLMLPAGQRARVVRVPVDAEGNPIGLPPFPEDMPSEPGLLYPAEDGGFIFYSEEGPSLPPGARVPAARATATPTAP